MILHPFHHYLARVAKMLSETKPADGRKETRRALTRHEFRKTVRLSERKRLREARKTAELGVAQCRHVVKPVPVWPFRSLQIHKRGVDKTRPGWARKRDRRREERWFR